MVGRSITNSFKQEEEFIIFSSNRSDTNLFNFEETRNLIENFKPDILVNAAAKVGGIVANNEQRTQFLIENLKINLNILEACIKHENIKIINLGSSCIYPLNAKNPIKEDEFMNGKLEPTNSPYAMAKLTAIELGNAMKSQYGHSVINLMPTNLYGPNDNFSEKDSHVIPGLMSRMHQSKLKDDKEFFIWGTGNPLREFLYVDDLAEAIEFISKQNLDIDLLNVGSGSEISIKKLAEKIKNTIEYKGELKFNSKMPDGNPRKLLDSTLINKYGWVPKVDLDKGLKNTYTWYLENF